MMVVTFSCKHDVKKCQNVDEGETAVQIGCLHSFPGSKPGLLDITKVGKDCKVNQCIYNAEAEPPVVFFSG